MASDADHKRLIGLHNWQPFYGREAALCAPAIPAILLVGFLTGDLPQATVATGAAFSVGFGAARDLRGRRWGAMVAAALGMAIATFAGSLAGQVPAVSLGLACAMAAVCAALALYDEDLWWVWLQMMIAALVASYYPGSVAVAGARTAAVVAGGLVQIGCVLALSRIAPHASGPLPRSAPKTPPTRSAVVWHMIRAIACVSIALGGAWRLGLSNSYWAPMTAMIVLKPGLRDTGIRGLERLGGTLAGGVGATAFAAIAFASPWAVVVAIGATATAAFALQKAHYAALSSAITATVVLLITFAHGPALESAEHRLWATLLGGFAALGCAWIAPRRAIWLRKAFDRVG